MNTPVNNNQEIIKYPNMSTSAMLSSASKNLLYVVAEDHYFLSHRLPMARAAEQAGFKVMVAAPVGKSRPSIEKAGFHFYPLYSFNRGSLSLYQEINALWELIRLYRQLKPAVVHHIAMKPVLYGSIAALFSPMTTVINTLGGLGFMFISSSLKATILRSIVGTVLMVLFRRSRSLLILQNPDDQQTVLEAGWVKKEKTVLIPGSGVDPEFYAATPEPPVSPEGPVVAYVGRLLWDKGLGELVEAARLLKNQGVKAQFWLYGDIDLHNPASLTREEVRAWDQDGLIQWKGVVQDSRLAYQHCHIAVLPSYREGLPKSLLEAASSARPIVTTDVPGCREVVRHHLNGFLVPARTVLPLAEALKRLIYDSDLRQQMGQAGRKRVLTYFTDALITEKTREIYLQYV
jgi:glycosyltransferase involved in cell wall biosynthesis